MAQGRLLFTWSTPLASIFYASHATADSCVRAICGEAQGHCTTDCSPLLPQRSTTMSTHTRLPRSLQTIKDYIIGHSVPRTMLLKHECRYFWTSFGYILAKPFHWPLSRSRSPQTMRNTDKRLWQPSEGVRMLVAL